MNIHTGEIKPMAEAMDEREALEQERQRLENKINETLHELNKIESKLVKHGKDWRPMQRMATHREIRSHKIGRNDPCGCGSGKKFKRYCYLKQ